jgi:hypothetical protein
MFCPNCVAMATCAARYPDIIMRSFWFSYEQFCNSVPSAHSSIDGTEENRQWCPVCMIDMEMSYATVPLVLLDN